MAATKTEDGVAYPAEAYLVVPDPELPSGWKLRIWETPELKVTPRQLGRAAAALGPGFRGRRVLLTREQRQAAIRRLRALYRQQDVKDADLPPVLQAAAHLVAQDRLHRNLRKLMASLPQEAKAEPWPEIEEDLALVEHFHAGITASDETGAVSFETMQHGLDAALRIYHKTLHMEVYGHTGPEMVYDCSGIRTVATFPEAIVYEHYGNLYQVSYRMAGTQAVLGDDHVEVTAEFLPVEGEGVHQEAAQVIVEARPSAPLREAQLDREARVIAGTVLITGESVNGVHGKRRYSEKALRQIAKMAEGLPAFANHVEKEQAFQPRDVKDLIGRHRAVRYDADRARVLSDLHVVEHQADWVFALAEDLADVVGNSLVSRGLVRMEGDTEIVEDILAVRSGDLVSDPGATRGLFEHRTAWGQRGPAAPHGKEDLPMTLDEIRTYLAAHATEAATLFQEMAAQSEAAQAEARKLAEAEQRLQAVTAQLAEATQKLDALKAAEAVRQKTARLAEVLGASALGTRFGKTPGAVSDRFRALLLEADEAAWEALIADRVAVLDEAARGAGQAPRSAFKAEDNGEIPAEAYTRAYRALVG